MTREELKEHCKRQVQQFKRVEKIMPVTPNDWKRYEEHKLILELLEQEPRWIPVTERLPEEPEVGKEYHDPSESVLVQLSNGEMKVSRYWSYRRSTLNCIVNDWIDLYSFEEVIAWMPLPKPYSEVEND